MYIKKVIAEHFRINSQSYICGPLASKYQKNVDVTVEGWLVGVYDGSNFGWWGPVSGQVANLAKDVFEAIDNRCPSSPTEWARRARQDTRHAHTGLLSLAVGALELACWDLVGQQANAPVWALFGEAKRESIPTYATCFGFEGEEASTTSVAEAVSEFWTIQKWRPSRDPKAISTLASAAGGDYRLALDFGGKWLAQEVQKLCVAIDQKLAWLEEPYAPYDLHQACPGDFPAPHAAGEHIYNLSETAILMAAGVDIWQPDALFCGGFSNLCDIAKKASHVNARCLPHGGGFLPAVHAAIAGIPMEYIEYHLLLEPKRQAHLELGVFPTKDIAIEKPLRPGWAGRLHPELEKQFL